MANTLIQIKRSDVTATPPNASLAEGEQAYSYSSNTLFIGASDGVGVIAIGGKYYLDTITSAFAAANAAFNQANNAAGDAIAVGIASNNYAAEVGAAANGWANTISATRADASNSYAQTVGTAGNNYTNTVGTAGNNYTNTVGTAGNNYTITVGAAANGWSNTVGADAKGYANSTFVKLTAATQTITGNLNIVGDLTLSGNTFVIDATRLEIDDPLIYLAANNYTSDIVDIGFIGNYVNATGQNVHTGLYREHVNKEYYLFQGYDVEPINNHIGAFSNNMTLAVLNADIKTSNLILGGANAILTIGAAFASANAGQATGNAAFASANAGQATGNAAFAQANTARDHANTAHASANAGLLQANTARDHANTAHASANAGMAIANASYAFANSAHSTANLAFTHANNAYALANSATAQAANASFMTSGTVASGRISGIYTGITGVGTLTNGKWNADVITVPYGGTGMITFTTNGILYGNAAGDLKVTAAGTEGQVLQASSSGVPQFAMLDGGTF